MKPIERTIFEEEVYYWSQQVLDTPGEKLMDKPLGNFKAKHRAIDHYRKHTSREVGFQHIAPDHWLEGENPCPCAEDLMVEHIDAAGAEIPEPDQVVEVWGIFETLRDVAEEDEKWSQYLGFTVRLSNLDCKLKDEHLDWIQAVCGDYHPENQMDISRFMGYGVRSKGRYVTAYATMKRKYCEALEAEGISAAGLLES